MNKRVLAVIPARGGSKRVPRKNIREVGGKPLIAHSIEQAQNAAVVDRAIVSTEDADIKSVALAHGGDIPFDRPKTLATDEATSDDVVHHVLKRLQEQGDRYDIVCLVPVTTPMRTPGDITGAVEKLRDSEADSVVGITECEHPPFWAVESDGDFVKPYFDEHTPWEKTRTQESPVLFRPNGAIFAADVETFLSEQSFYIERTAGYRMSPSRSLDIDESFDLKLTRALFEYDR